MNNTNLLSEEINKDNCSHIWEPAGHRKNKDRVHNKGKGKYKAYKCSECGKFKRRYLK